MKTLQHLPRQFKTRTTKQSHYLSPTDVRVYLRAVLNLVKAGHSPEVVTKALDDFIAAYKIQQKKSPRCRSRALRLTKKL